MNLRDIPNLILVWFEDVRRHAIKVRQMSDARYSNGYRFSGFEIHIAPTLEQASFLLSSSIFHKLFLKAFGGCFIGSNDREDCDE